MIALAPLPGSPRYGDDDAEIRDRALSDLSHYAGAGLDSAALGRVIATPGIGRLP